MTKREARAKVAQQLSSGKSKSETFVQLAGQGIKDSQLAYFVASYADPGRCDEHERKVKVLVVLMFIQALFSLVLGLALGAKIGPNAKWIFGAALGMIPLLFAWGFYTDRVGAYNAYIMLGIIGLPKSLEGFSSAPIGTSVSVAIAVGLLAYVWYVRDKIFPGWAFVTPKRVKGQYIFEG